MVELVFGIKVAFTELVYTVLQGDSNPQILVLLPACPKSIFGFSATTVTVNDPVYPMVASDFATLSVGNISHHTFKIAAVYYLKSHNLVKTNARWELY